MFSNEHEPLALLIELTPKLAKRRFRDDIYKAWDHKCAYCEEEATSLDHIVPRFKSGSSNRNNLAPSCRRCNTGKASSKLEEWYIRQPFFTEARMNKIYEWTKHQVSDLFTCNKDSITSAA